MKYVAWMKYRGEHGNGAPVCSCSTLNGCQEEARKVHNAESWVRWAEGRDTKIRITRGDKQLFAKAYVLPCVLGK